MGSWRSIRTESALLSGKGDTFLKILCLTELL